MPAIHPDFLFFRVKRIVGHYDRTHTRHLQDSRNVRFNFLGAEKRPGLFEVGTICGQVECFENGNDAAGGLRDRTILNEQGLPDGIGLLAFRHLPIALGRKARRAEQFRFQIVIRQQFVDAPQTDVAKLWRKQVSVNVDKLRGRDYFIHRPLDLVRVQQIVAKVSSGWCSFHSFLRFRSEACT